MLTEKQVLKIREHLEKAQNPLFFYDNDVDGLCSYVILRRYINRGKGVAVRSHPDVDEGYARKVQELSADYVFVLDRPILGQRFVDEIKKLQLPIVWIDHHDVPDEEYVYKDLEIFNPTRNKGKSEEPVTYWSYRVSNKKEDVWLALMGCVADHHLPDFVATFREHYPEYWATDKDIDHPFAVYYGTEIGRLAKALSFGLKDSITHVVQLQNLLINAKGPEDIFRALESGSPIALKYRDLRKKYDLLIEKAKQNVSDRLVFFTYGGNMSISSDLANELSFMYPDKVIVVAYTSGPITNISMRSHDVQGILNRILPDFENATGGGHKDAVGARIQSSDLERFKKAVTMEIAKR